VTTTTSRPGSALHGARCKTKNTVVRGGYGVYNYLMDGNYELNRESNFLWNISDSLANSNALQPSLSLDNPFPQLGVLPSMVGSPMVDPTKRDGYVQQWNFDIQQAFSPKWMVDVGYAGSVADHLEDSYPLISLTSGQVRFNRAGHFPI